MIVMMTDGVSTRSMFVLIPKRLRVEIKSIAQSYSPFEACGLLLAEFISEAITLRGISVCRNLARDRVKGFRLSINDLQKAKSDWCSCQCRFVGTFHTHSLCSAKPSIHDRLAMRARPGLYLIADTEGGLRVFVSKFNRLLRATVINPLKGE